MSGIDYEKLAEGVVVGEPEVEEPQTPETATVQSILHAGREYLPLTHEKYQGIAGQKGYSTNPNINRLQRVHYSHEAMIDVIITEPTLTQIELAKRFERTENWISIIMGSDAFQAALAKRRDDVLDPFLVATIDERLRGLATQSLNILAEKLETTRNADLAIKSLDLASKALGMGARAAGGNTVQNNFVVQLPAQIPSSADWAKAHQSVQIEG